ncbi:uncharacterized protein LOC118202877 isoform X2 [Stegodyphus dumicola]|nr:uncharacterized protein LOC118202877 isoform X2 [Stegodyphus dumicola]XP_035230978.1 uncharacterized protein LOC118202877 isoform X2 [Stegodyphus dumicola]XP_035230979.1 uncharacterized protein LOC118202877 isoform X2 [Stegodyphus dumicola]XP_035230981.1 uncharacterized protein LOC118202877 isoform X2 [Stegodyphus dumicola]
MDMKQENASLENDGRYRKFGLPSWMVNNIERLNFVTDFEQYACSPPENECFLTDHMNNLDIPATESYCPAVEPSNLSDTPKIEVENTAATASKEVEIPTSDPYIKTVDHSPTLYHSILNSIKHEEFHSSPDSTPCATPEPSPAPRRKMSGQKDTVQTNPGRWFYLGNLKKPKQNVKGQTLSVKENKSKEVKKSSDSVLAENDERSKREAVKLVISNFDINAISPTSW